MWSKQVQGNNRPLFVLHGWGQTHQNLEPLADLLKSKADPFLYDLPGFGKSPIPPDVWSTDDYAKRLIEEMDSKGIKQISVLGHSFGGKIAICLASRYPKRIKQLILLAPSGLRPALPFSKKIKSKGIRLAGKLIKTYDALFQTTHFADAFIPQYGSSDYRNAGAMRPILVKTVNEDLTDRLPSVRCPTLLLWGELDTATPPEIGVRMARLIPNCRYQLFPNHGHQLFEDVGAHLMASYILPFLEAGS
jgi:pimeloyl-ACP methyl ester carboxylesterase